MISTGCDRLTAIMRGDELAGFLHKALEIEKTYETVAEWEGYVSVKKKEFRNVLFQLVSDSSGHVRIVESLLKMVHAGNDYGGLPIQSRVFNFGGKNESEVMGEISRIENIMFDIYSDIREALQDSDIPGLLIDNENTVPFMTALDNLIADEARHMSIISKYVRKLDRLR
jgi:rubrerythrin